MMFQGTACFQQPLKQRQRLKRLLPLSTAVDDQQDRRQA
jgi:hypothetical protein